MALGNTPLQRTGISLEARKSFALSAWFKNSDGTPYDLANCTVRLVAKYPSYISGEDAISAAAEIAEPATGLAVFKLQASDLDLEPAEYEYDATLEDASGYSLPVLKGSISIGSNADAYSANEYVVTDQGGELTILMGSSCVIEVCLGPGVDTDGPMVDTTWTFVGPDDPGNPVGSTNPFGTSSMPLWVDTSDGGEGASGDSEWNTPWLVNKWESYAGQPHVRYRRTATGIVQIEGTVAPGRLLSTIFALPPGYCPGEGRLIFDAACERGSCRIDVLSSGDVVHASGDVGAWVSLTLSFFGEEGTTGGGEEEEDMYGEHLIVWSNGGWVYRGAVITSRPATIPPYTSGARAVWDTSMDPSFAEPPAMAEIGDIWFPHGDVDPLA